VSTSSTQAYLKGRVCHLIPSTDLNWPFGSPSCLVAVTQHSPGGFDAIVFCFLVLGTFFLMEKVENKQWVQNTSHGLRRFNLRDICLNLPYLNSCPALFPAKEYPFYPRSGPVVWSRLGIPWADIRALQYLGRVHTVPLLQIISKRHKWKSRQRRFIQNCCSVCPMRYLPCNRIFSRCKESCCRQVIMLRLKSRVDV
jgi:hypothetical protein